MMLRLFATTALCLLAAGSLAMGQDTTTGPAGQTGTGAATTTTTTTTTKEEKKTDITADQMQLLDKEKRAIFTGNVVMVRSDVTWTCDKMVIDYEETKQDDGTSKTDVKTIDSNGTVKIVTKKQVITGEWAKMDVKANKLQVGGNVKVVQDKSILTGELLNSDLNTNESQMTGGRVKGSFLPK